MVCSVTAQYAGRLAAAGRHLHAAGAEKGVTPAVCRSRDGSGVFSDQLSACQA